MIIDKKGAETISKWFKENTDNTIHCLTIKNKNDIVISTKNIQEFATMKILLAKNNIKYELCNNNNDIKKISDN